MMLDDRFLVTARGIIRPAAALLLWGCFAGAFAFAQDSTMADCPPAAQTPAPPMPMPNLKMDEPMPTGMAKDGAKKGDVMQSAERWKGCMDRTLEKDQQDLSQKAN